MLKSIRTKMLFIFSILILLLMFVSSFFLYNEAGSILKDTIYSAAKNSAQQNAQIITEWLKGTANELNSISNTSTIKSMDWSKQLPVLNGSLKTHDDYEMMYIIKNDGTAKFSTGENADLSDREYFKKAMNTGKVVFSDPITSKATGARVISVAQPIFNDENIKPIGVVAATLKLDYLQKLVKNMHIRNYGYGWIINSKQITIAHPDEKYIGNTKILEVGNQELRDIALRMADGETDTVEYKLNGIDKGLAFYPVKINGWSIAMTAKQSDILAPLSVIRNISLWSAIIAVLIGIIITYYIANFIAGPINAATEHAEILAKGDFTNDVPDRFLARNDEIGRLAEAFEKMTVNLRKMITQVREIAGKVAASSEELSASGDQVGQAAQEVNSAIQNVASGAEEQSARIDETSVNIGDLIEQINVIETNSDTMNESADDVMSNIKKGNSFLNASIEKVNNVKVDSISVTDNIHSLGKLSEEIGEIIDLINNIAAQTNLLALNAAIEAARAGEAGRGFSVVADEIRELAEESSDATEKIDRLIKEIQHSVNDAVVQMEDNAVIVDESVEAIGSTGQSFDEINSAAEKLLGLINDISIKAREMSVNSHDVSDAVEQIASVSQESAGNAEEVAASSEEQSAATEEIISASNELAEMAGQLSEAVDQFKL